MQRRKFLHTTTRAGIGLGVLGLYACGQETGPDQTTTTDADTPAKLDAPDWFKISLAQWSLNKDLFAGKLDNLDFAKKTREEFGLGGVEYVNQFFADKAEDKDYLQQMKTRAMDHDVESLLIMIDREGDLGSTDAKERMQAVENHHKWVEAAQFLGCHSIRVNAAGKGTREEVAAAATEGLRALSTFAQDYGLNVIVENHGGYSSDGEWLAGVIESVGLDNCGTLPDFGNFCIERNDPEDYGKGCKTEFDRYRGVELMMPYAKAVSAKANVFNDEGWEVESDYEKLLTTVKNAGYRGWIGIEYEGSGMTADAGIRATRDLLLKAGAMV